MKISFTEIMVVCIVALIVLGPDSLPKYARKFGLALKEFKKATNDLTSDIKENVVAPLDEAVKPIKDAIEPLTDIESGIKDSLNDVTESINNIGLENQ